MHIKKKKKQNKILRHIMFFKVVEYDGAGSVISGATQSSLCTHCENIIIEFIVNCSIMSNFNIKQLHMINVFRKRY